MGCLLHVCFYHRLFCSSEGREALHANEAQRAAEEARLSGFADAEIIALATRAPEAEPTFQVFATVKIIALLANVQSSCCRILCLLEQFMGRQEWRGHTSASHAFGDPSTLQAPPDVTQVRSALLPREQLLQRLQAEASTTPDSGDISIASTEIAPIASTLAASLLSAALPDLSARVREAHERQRAAREV